MPSLPLRADIVAASRAANHPDYIWPSPGALFAFRRLARSHRMAGTARGRVAEWQTLRT